MDKNAFALTPPMGWNSYDYYDTAVTEERVKANADFMAKRLKPFGWEYVVVDIAWYAYGVGTQRDRFQYLPFGDIELDEYSRAVPCPDRFPSSKGGKGFKPLADYVHGLGLKFGIHIMRGIPRIAAHSRGALLGPGGGKSALTADEIADPASICAWNPDMYGLFPDAPGAREYYESLFALYAGWGVDFVKCDDICRMDAPSSKKEIELLQEAVQKCGRPIVLSLSPGPARIEEAWHYAKYSNMWRITDDMWDNWPHLRNMFDRCELWQRHVGEGSWPDCDMLPLGTVGKGFGAERKTLLSAAEQKTLMTLWCVFRSPLMLGAELTLLDGETLSLLTNPAVLRLVTHGRNPRQVERAADRAVWLSEDAEDGSAYLAAFNLGEEAGTYAPSGYALEALDAALDRAREASRALGHAAAHAASWTDLWTGETVGGKGKSPPAGPPADVELEAHGARLFKITRA